MKLSWGNSVKKLDKAFSNSQKDMEKRIEKIVDLTARDAKHDAENGTPVLTGRLKRGWKTERVKGRGRNRQVDVSNAVPYAKSVENGNIKRAPARMLGKAVTKGKRIMQRRLNKAKKENSQKFNRGT